MAYLSTTVNWDTIGSITNPLISKKVADNITTQIPLLYLLDKMGNKEYESGGTQYNLPVFKELQNAQAYTALTTLSYADTDPVTSAIYNRKQLTVPVTLTGTKLLQNSGNDDTAIVSYMEVIIEAAQESMKSAMDGSTYGIFSSNGESDLGITGLQNIVSSTPTTGTTGSLSRVSYTWWRNQTADIATNFQTSGLAAFRELFVECIRGNEVPTVCIVTQSMWINLHRSLTSTIQYNLPTPNTQSGDLGFQHIYFQGVPVMFGSNVPANTGYMLNLKYLKFLVHKDRDMVFRDFITPTDQDALVGRLYWAGNLVASNLSRQGVFTGSGDTY
jgi:hypothetical protein